MKKQLFFVVVLMAFFGQLQAQTLKTDVLVIGNGNTAVAAGLQAAISGVKTTILLQADGFDISAIDNGLSSGIQATFLQKTRNAKQIKDSLQTPIFNAQTANEVLKAWTDSLKNLSIIRNVTWVKAERSGKNWSFKLSNGSTLKPKVLINPGDEKLNNALKISTTKNGWTVLDYSNTIYRTSVAGGPNATLFSMYQFFVPAQENLIWISDTKNMLLGQAGGATAAYAAFFNTKTSLSKLKTIQGELINYKLNLIPFSDIKNTDSNWKAIQFVGVTGVLKAEINEVMANFYPNKLVSTTEVKQPIKDYFYKAQIWFDDYTNLQMTIGSTIDMVCYVGNKALISTKKEIEKKWKTTYQFKTELDLNRSINRREFAVLVQDYMPPFNVNIDKDGKVVR